MMFVIILLLRPPARDPPRIFGLWFNYPLLWPVIRIYYEHDYSRCVCMSNEYVCMWMTIKNHCPLEVYTT